MRPLEDRAPVPGVHRRLCECGEVATITTDTSHEVSRTTHVQLRRTDCQRCGREIRIRVPLDGRGTNVDASEAGQRRERVGVRLRRVERWLAKRLLTQPEDGDERRT